MSKHPQQNPAYA